MLLFNRPTKHPLPKFNRSPVLFYNYETNHTVFINRQSVVNKDVYTYKHVPLLPVGLTVAVQCKDGGP